MVVNIRVDVTVVSEMVEAGVGAGAGGSVVARVETGVEDKNGEVVVAAVVSAPETVVMETIGVVSEKEGG